LGITENNNYDPPSINEVEINLFGGGNGIGECIVIHLTGNNWIIIDSFINTASRNSIALDYLNEIGVDSSNIKYIIASHWHDDHVEGISTIYKHSPTTKFCLSSALKLEQLTRLISINHFKECHNSGVNEFAKVAEFSKIHKKKNRRLSEGHQLFENDPNIELKILSPSTGSIEYFEKEFSTLLESSYNLNLKTPNLNPNHSCITIQIKIGEHKILLGADLEVKADRSLGWYAIIDGDYVYKDKSINVFKVPHHGSENGHCDEQWQQLLKEDCYTLLTAYNKGRKKLPTVNDKIRINANTKNAYLTFTENVISKKKRDKTVKKYIKELGYKITENNYGFGHIRLRSMNNSAFRITLFGTAVKIN
jgi:beta-lactamase superfamily II metal-dependent hydrolase